MPTTTGLRFLLAMSLAVASIAGCGADEPDTDTGRPAAEATTTPPAPPPPPPVPTLEEIAASCPWPTATEAAAEYEGDGPHPYVIDTSFGIPPFAGADGRAEDIEDLQLIVCVSDRSLDRVVGECEYTGDVTIHFVAVEFDVSIYTARTAHKVDEITVVGEDYKCPTILTGASDGDEKDATIDDDEAEKIIEDFVNGPARTD